MLKKKITAAVLILMLVLPVFAVSTLAAYTDRLYDEAGILDVSEKERLYDRFEEVSDRHTCDIAAAIVNSYSEGDIVKAADDYYDGKMLGQGADGSGIILYICMGTREYAFSTKGFAITAFNDDALSYLEGRVIGLLSDGEYYEAFNEYANSADYLLGLAEEGRPYGTRDISEAHTVLEKKDARGFHPKQLAAAIVIAFIIALIVTLILKAQLKSIHRQTTAGSYVTDEGLTLTASRDIFLYRTVTRTPRAKSSSGGGSGRSSVHMSSGGSFHGGSHGRF